MDGDYYYVVEVAVCLTRDTPAAPACLPYGFARRDGLLTQSQCRHFPWHFRDVGTIQLFLRTKRMNIQRGVALCTH